MSVKLGFSPYGKDIDREC